MMTFRYNDHFVGNAYLNVKVRIVCTKCESLHNLNNTQVKLYRFARRNREGRLLLLHHGAAVRQGVSEALFRQVGEKSKRT